MSHHYEFGNGGYNNYKNRGGGYRQNQPRINENEVPQSKHTIFVRGLPGDVTTDEIMEYIGQRFGKITFDFVKHSPDRSKLFVAVRFEKRDEAKEFMENYTSHDFMGSRCDLSWFRDIRRYCAYKRSKQVRSNSQRRRRRSDSDDSRRSASPTRRSRSVSRSRSASRSPSRSRSRTNSDRSRSRTRSRSVSRSSRRSNRTLSTGGVDEEELEKARGRERQARSKRRRELSVSEDEEDSADEKPRRKAREELPQIPLPPKKQEASPALPPKPAKPPVFIPPPTVDMDVESPKPSPPAPQNPYQRSFEKKEPSPTNVHSTAYAVPMEEEAAPKVIVREAQAPVPVPSYPIPTHTATVNPVPVATAPPTAQRSFVPRQVAKFEFVMPTKLPVPSPTAVTAPLISNGTTEDDRLTTTNKLFGDLKVFQTALISTVKFEAPIKDEDEGGSLFLSSQLEDSELRKSLEREEKLNKLNADQNVQFLVKKNQFEKSFRGDCETFAAVTRGLLSKNESLAIPIKIALFENMDDMYKKFLKRVDDLLDTMMI